MSMSIWGPSGKATYRRSRDPRLHCPFRAVRSPSPKSLSCSTSSPSSGKIAVLVSFASALCTSASHHPCDRGHSSPSCSVVWKDFIALRSSQSAREFAPRSCVITKCDLTSTSSSTSKLTVPATFLTIFLFESTADTIRSSDPWRGCRYSVSFVVWFGGRAWSPVTQIYWSNDIYHHEFSAGLMQIYF